MWTFGDGGGENGRGQPSDAETWPRRTLLQGCMQKRHKYISTQGLHLSHTSPPTLWISLYNEDQEDVRMLIIFFIIAGCELYSDASELLSCKIFPITLNNSTYHQRQFKLQIVILYQIQEYSMYQRVISAVSPIRSPVRWGPALTVMEVGRCVLWQYLLVKSILKHRFVRACVCLHAAWGQYIYWPVPALLSPHPLRKWQGSAIPHSHFSGLSTPPTIQQVQMWLSPACHQKSCCI